MKLDLYDEWHEVDAYYHLFKLGLLYENAAMIGGILMIVYGHFMPDELAAGAGIGICVSFGIRSAYRTFI